MRLVLAALLIVAASAGAQTGAAIGSGTPSTGPIPSSLLGIKRVYVEALSGDYSAEAIRQLVISSLQQTRMFMVTDNPDRADAILRGAANDTAFTDTFDSVDGVNARANAGAYSAKSTSNKGDGAYGGISVGENDAHHIKERKHEAFATVRLCNRDGDVLWATTQESKGAKFRGASADVADKVVRQLQLDVNKMVRDVEAVKDPRRQTLAVPAP
jgi:hypothetical protein